MSCIVSTTEPMVFIIIYSMGYIAVMIGINLDIIPIINYKTLITNFITDDNIDFIGCIILNIACAVFKNIPKNDDMNDLNVFKTSVNYFFRLITNTFISLIDNII